MYALFSAGLFSIVLPAAKHLSVLLRLRAARFPAKGHSDAITATDSEVMWPGRKPPPVMVSRPGWRVLSYSFISGIRAAVGRRV
jgi:hypothetical protein